MLVTAAVAGLVALVINLLSLGGLSLQERLANMIPFTVGWLIILVVAAWRSLGYNIRAWFTIVLTYLLGIWVFYRGGMAGSGREWMLLPPVLAFVLLGSRPGFGAAIFSTLVYIVFAILFTQTSLRPPVASEPHTLETWAAEGASFLLVIAISALLLWAFARNWLEALRETNTASKELEETNIQLHRQASQLQATAEIVRAGSFSLDPDTLQAAVVDRIQERFSLMGVYFVGLFLLDDEGTGDDARLAVLKAATGEAGQLLLDMDYSLNVDESTTIGWCVAHQQARMVQDVEGSVRLGALPMPNTRTEIALPLHSRGRVMGALNVHSTHEATFSEHDLTILQTLADQIAVSLDNARLFSTTEAALEEVQTAHRRYLIEAWEGFLATQPTSRVDLVQPGTEPGDEDFLREARRAAMVYERTIATSGPPSGSDDESPQTALVVPLKLREQVIGTIALQEPRSQRPWTTEDIALAEAVAEQVALTVENLRLVDDTQRRAARERLLGDISDQMQRATDMETLMRIATEELNRTLSGSRTYVRMSPALSLHPSAGDRQVGTESNRETTQASVTMIAE
jgi:GAF domain-containing protein